MRKLISRYKDSTDVDTQIVVAKTRYAEAFTYWFRGDDGAGPLLKKVISQYDHAGNSQIEAIAAEARITFVMSKHNARTIRRYVDPIVTRYRNASDPDLARAYAGALFQLSGLERKAGHIAEAQRLYVEATKTYKTRVEPFRPPADPRTGPDCL